MIRNIISFLMFFNIALSVSAQTSQKKLYVQFEENKIFSSSLLTNKLNLCLIKNSKTKSEYDVRLIDYCLRQGVLKFLFSKGYLAAKVKESKIQEDQQNQKVTVSLEEGPLYRYGNIDVQEAKVFTPAQILKLINIRKGAVVDGDRLQQWLYEKLPNLYANKGYLQSFFDMEPDFKPSDKNVNEGVFDLKISADEGKLFTISRIEFAGNDRTAESVLRKSLLIKENELFNKGQLDASIKKLNNLRLFERIDKDNDVELRAGDGIPFLKIRIKVKEKSFD